jgi:hypothetical protein
VGKIFVKIQQLPSRKRNTFAQEEKESKGRILFFFFLLRENDRKHLAKVVEVHRKKEQI